MCFWASPVTITGTDLRDKFGLDHLKDDPNYASNEARVAMRPVTLPMIAAIMKQYDHDEMLALLEAIEVPFSPVAKPSDLYDDPQLNAGGRMLNVRMPTGAMTKLPRLPIEVGNHDFGLRRQPPEPGEHTAEALAEAGFTAEEIAGLAASGAVKLGSA